MIEKRRVIDTDWKKFDAREVTPEEYEDIPELTDDDFERGVLHIGGVPIRRGRPKAEKRKALLSVRLDTDIIDHFRATGPGWQRRINDALRKAARLRPTSKAATGKAVPAKRTAPR
jgi:uncharacterized protein (DUF4415 family)